MSFGGHDSPHVSSPPLCWSTDTKGFQWNMRVSYKSLVLGLCALHPGLYTLEQIKLLPKFAFAPAISSASSSPPKSSILFRVHESVTSSEKKLSSSRWGERGTRSHQEQLEWTQRNKLEIMFLSKNWPNLWLIECTGWERRRNPGWLAGGPGRQWCHRPRERDQDRVQRG